MWRRKGKLIWKRREHAYKVNMYIHTRMRLRDEGGDIILFYDRYAYIHIPPIYDVKKLYHIVMDISNSPVVYINFHQKEKPQKKLLLSASRLQPGSSFFLSPTHPSPFVP